MNLFSKKSALLALTISSALFLMSFNQKDTHYCDASLQAKNQNELVVSESFSPSATCITRIAYIGVREMVRTIVGSAKNSSEITKVEKETKIENLD